METGKPKRKIIKDRKFPTSEQIGQQQNFDRLHKDYSVIKKIMLKKNILWSGAAAICVTAVAVLAYALVAANHTKPVTTSKHNTALAVTQPCVQPPIPGKEMPYTVYRVSVKDGATLHYASGSTIVIPANAFHQNNGEPLGDSVDVKYREFHTPLDIFLSGIPMQYDSAGLSRTLESAGMIEIRAVDKGRELLLNEETPIDIQMASANDESRFNLYELDTIHKNWIYKGKDKIEKQGPYKTYLPKEDHQQAVTPGNAMKPAMADPQHFSFKIKYEKDQFPELAAYNNVQFEVTDNSFKPAYYKINWKKIELVKVNSLTAGSYMLALSKADTTIYVQAQPVFGSADYQSALKQFDAQQQAASKAQQAKDAEAQKAVALVNKQLAGYSSRQFVTAAFGAAGVNASVRGFQVRSFGYHNIDFPIPPILVYAYRIMSTVKEPNPALKNAGESYGDIYLVQKGRNTVFRFSKGEPVRCDPRARNLMWTFLNNDKIAFFRIADYNTLVNGGANNIEPVPAPSQDQALREIREFSL